MPINVELTVYSLYSPLLTDIWQTPAVRALSADCNYSFMPQQFSYFLVSSKYKNYIFRISFRNQTIARDSFSRTSIKSSECWYSYKCGTINLTVLYNGNQLLSMEEDLSKHCPHSPGTGHFCLVTPAVLQYRGRKLIWNMCMQLLSSKVSDLWTLAWGNIF